MSGRVVIAIRACLLACVALTVGCGRGPVGAAGAGAASATEGTEVAASHHMRVPPPLPPATPPTPFHPACTDAWLWLVRDPPEERGEADPAQAVHSLYITHRALGAAGVPRGYHISRYRPWISARLARDFAFQALERDAFIAAHPDAKPPHIEGDMFVGVQEGYIGYRLGARAPLAEGRVAFELQVNHRDDQGSAQSTGRAIAVRESGRWVVDEIAFGDDHAFAQRGHPGVLPGKARPAGTGERALTSASR